MPLQCADKSQPPCWPSVVRCAQVAVLRGAPVFKLTSTLVLDGPQAALTAADKRYCCHAPALLHQKEWHFTSTPRAMLEWPCLDSADVVDEGCFIGTMVTGTMLPRLPLG